MKNILKQFEDWAINFKTDPFLKARLKLTAYYALGLVFVLLIFNIATYGLFLFGLEEFEDEALKDQQELYKDRIENSLFVSGTLFSVVIAGLSYSFAGKSLEPAEIAYKKQKQFVADCAHELRTPLTVMKAGIENTLNKEPDVAECKLTLKESMDEINSLTTMVNDLLFLVSNERKTINLYSEFDLVKFLEREIEYFSPLIAAKKLDLYYMLPSHSITIKANRTQVKRLFSNLLSNAINYNNLDGNISIVLTQVGSRIELSISDSGIGISSAHLDHIFERFYKVDKSRASNSVGSGLGLSIVKEIIDNHGWKIEYSSELNKGTKVTVFI